MCGINAILSQARLNPEIIRNMNVALNHRGPDASGIHTFSGNKVQCVLGARRLAIMDTHARASQPMLDITEKYGLVYNGELYNYAELKNELLDRGYSFHTSSDTEVLLYWLIEKGKAGLAHLKGMFAFAFYDLEKETLICARDGQGMKPLFYGLSPSQQLVVSSEIGALRKAGLLNTNLNREQIDEYLTFKSARSPDTFFSGIKEVMPGQWLEWKDKDLTIGSFKKEIKQKVPNSEQEALDHVRQLLIDSVRGHVVADVPVGLFFSGGVDSSLLAVLLKEEGIDLPLFTMANDPADDKYGTEDRSYSNKIATYLGRDVEHFVIQPPKMDVFDNYIHSFDQPIADSGSFMTYQLAQHASKKVKVVLSGAGADEYFAGYNRHMAFKKYLTNKKILTSVAGPLLTGLNMSSKLRISAIRLRLYQKFLNSVNKDSGLTFANFLALGLRKAVRSVEVQTLDEMLAHDQNNYLISDVLMMSDRMTMAHGVEMRMPYLDTSLTDYVKSIPAEYVMQNGQKWILKRLLSKSLPERWVNRRKQGFGLPIGSWIKEDKISALTRLFQNKNSRIFEFYSHDVTSQLFDQHIRSKADLSSELWALITLAHWLEKEA